MLGKILIDYNCIANYKERDFVILKKAIDEINKNNMVYIAVDDNFSQEEIRNIEKKFNKHNIKVNKIIYCRDDLCGLIREYRIDVVLLSNKYIEEKSLDNNLDSVATSNMQYRQLYAKKNTLESCDKKLYIDYLPFYTRICYFNINNNKFTSTKRLSYINNVLEFAYQIEQLKKFEQEELNCRSLSYDYVPKTNIIGKDENWKKYWLGSKCENDIIDEEIFNLSPIEFVKRRNRFNLDDEFIKYLPYNRTFTYREIFDYIDTVKKALLELGMKKGDVVAIPMPNVVEEYILNNALTDLGIIVFPLHPLATQEKLERFFDIVKPNHIICLDMNDKNKIDLPKIIKKYNIKNTIIIEETSLAPLPIKLAFNLLNKNKSREQKRYILPTKYLKWEDLIAIGRKSKMNYQRNINKNDTIKYYTTGGTTSNTPKIVDIPYSMQNIVYYNSYGIDINRGESVIINYPRYIAFSDANCTHLPASAGLKLIFTPYEYPKDFAKIMEKEKIAVMQVAPQFYQMMLEDEKKGSFTNKDLSYVHFIVGGGDKWEKTFKKQVLDFFARHNNTEVQALVGYGCTELNGSALVELFGTQNYNQDSNIGIPLPNFKLKLVDEDGQEIEGENSKGKLYIGGKNMTMKGYLNDQVATNEVLINDDNTIYYNTADIISFQNNGIAEFITREKRFIMITKQNCSGKVVPLDIEHLICTRFPIVKECCVVGIEESQEVKLKMVITLNDVSYDKIDELLSNIKQVAFQKDLLNEIDDIKILEQIPLTDRGKIDYRQVENIFTNEKKLTKKL